MRWVGLAWIACVLTACNAKAFACAGDSECKLGGEPGVCIEGDCAYPDPTCPSGFRYPSGAGSLAGSCAAGDGLGDTDIATGTTTGTTTTTQPPPTAGSDDSSTAHAVGSTSDNASSSSSAGETGQGGTTIADTGATTTGGPPSNCGELTCSGCASCVTELNGDCSEEAQACWAVRGCAEASACMIACAVDDDCTQDCCVDLSMEGVAALFDLHGCSADTCVPACNLFEEPPCG